MASHDHSRHDSHDHAGKGQAHSETHGHSQDHDHSHDHSHDGHAHDHSHDHSHDDHAHDHSHDHSHDHAPTVTADSAKRVRLAMILTAGFMLAEVIGGWISGSLALLADAGHMFSDSFSLGLALFAFYMGDKAPVSYTHLTLPTILLV